jgi:hypothetical protein
MLYKHWEKVYDPKDIDLWERLEGTAPPVIYPFQKNILYSLLAKYYRTNQGNSLHPERPKHATAYFEMLRRTMHELDRAVMERDSKHETEWYELRDKEEDLGAKLTREDEMKRDASFRRISYREEVYLGRFWINPENRVLSPAEAVSHHAWIKKHPELLTEQERQAADSPEFMKKLLSDGWIRISGAQIQMHSMKELPRVAEFLKEHAYKEEMDSSVWVITADPDDMVDMKIGDIISQHGISKQASSTVPNPLRRNFDYSNEAGGPEWQNRVKTVEDKKDKSAMEATSWRKLQLTR